MLNNSQITDFRIASKRFGRRRDIATISITCIALAGLYGVNAINVIGTIYNALNR